MRRDSLDDVLRDLLAWEAGGSIDTERERDTFAPSTLAYLRETYSGEGLDDEVQRLVALAQTPAWSPFHAAQLYARLREITADGEALFPVWLDEQAMQRAAQAMERARRRRLSEETTERNKLAAAETWAPLVAKFKALRANGYPEKEAIQKAGGASRDRRARLKKQLIALGLVAPKISRLSGRRCLTGRSSAEPQRRATGPALQCSLHFL